MIIASDRLNPQIAARLVPPLGRWRRLEPVRSALMREQLERIVDTRGLSRDVYEQASKSRWAEASAVSDPVRRLRARPHWRRG